MNKNIFSFIFTGTLFTIIGYLASYIDPILSSILYTFPFSILPIILYMKNSGKNNQQVSNFVKNASFGLSLSFIFMFSFSLSLYHTNSIYLSILISSILWLLFAFLYYNLII